jgi:hypothetical protein
MRQQKLRKEHSATNKIYLSVQGQLERVGPFGRKKLRDMTNKQAKRIEEAIGPLVGLALLEIAWYVVYWYFYLPEHPYTFRDAAGEWKVLLNQFPYSSATTFQELPAYLQQEYILTQAFVPIVVWILIGILDLIGTWIRGLFA